MEIRVLKIISFLLVVFLLTDCLIIIRILFRNFDDKITSESIKNTVAVFGICTLILFLTKLFIKKRLNKKKQL